jgi:hypothetical protein
MSMHDLESNPARKTPLRFWFYAGVAILTMILTVLWLANTFNPPSTSPDKNPKSLEDGRFLRPV